MTANFVLLIVICVAFFLAGRSRARRLVAASGARLNSLPRYHGAYATVCAGLAGSAAFGLWLAFGGWLTASEIEADLTAAFPTYPADRFDLLLTDVVNMASGGGSGDAELAPFAERYAALRKDGALIVGAAGLLAALAAGLLACRRVAPGFPARRRVERFIKAGLGASATLATLVTVGIVFSLLFETLRFFELVSPIEFLFGLDWSPQTALRADQVASEGAFGAVPVFAGTILITVIAMCIAAPIGLMAAIYTTQYAAPKTRAAIKPALEVLAGIPTVVYGFFAALTVAPFIRGLGESLGLDVASESALAAGLVMGIMIIPFVSSLSDDALAAVPQSMRDGSYALGATRSETIAKVLIPAALPGIMGAFLLAISRAIGETMIVVMAAGLAANLTANPLSAVTTVTVQIVTLLTGDQEFDSAKTLAAFALGLTLFAVTLGLNVAAARIVRKYREQYE